jgi:putative two-component system response regulator
MVAGILSDAGHPVVTARDGREAITLIREGAVRLVVSDWEMPRMTGPELCHAVRCEDLPAYVYLILLTTHDKVQDRVQGLSAGADDFLAKPFHPAELLARVGSGERVLALETRDVAIFALAKLAESRDPDTGAHLERVRSYSRVIAQYLAGIDRFAHEVDAEYIRLTYLTSPLHDIGKVGIPDSVLLKPGRLSQREFEIMKTHTTVGAQTLDAALERFPGVKFLEMARNIAGAHHERFDGSGYPRGLAGEAIPLCARIVALADVYDALTSRRIYKEASPHEAVRGMILESSGSHFDPAVVEAFIRNEERFVAIRDRFAEDEDAPRAHAA